MIRAQGMKSRYKWLRSSVDVIQWPLLGRLDELQQVCYELSAAQRAHAATHGRTGPLENARAARRRAQTLQHMSKPARLLE